MTKRTNISNDRFAFGKTRLLQRRRFRARPSFCCGVSSLLKLGPRGCGILCHPGHAPAAPPQACSEFSFSTMICLLPHIGQYKSAVYRVTAVAVLTGVIPTQHLVEQQEGGLTAFAYTRCSLASSPGTTMSPRPSRLVVSLTGGSASGLAHALTNKILIGPWTLFATDSITGPLKKKKKESNRVGIAQFSSAFGNEQLLSGGHVVTREVS